MTPQSLRSQKLGLVLTSGGARGAYQAGVLRAIAEFSPVREVPFRVMSGISAGSLNCGYLASRAEDYKKGVEGLWKLWAGLNAREVFRTDMLTAARIGVSWVTDLSLGGWVGSGRGKSLLDTSPLHQLVLNHVDPERIEQNIRSGLLRGLASTATNYQTGTAVSFFDAHPEVQEWSRSTRIGKREKLLPEHFLASASIPVFFPAVQIGPFFYGDGCIRLTAPLSPTIHLGADRVLAIGVRYQRSSESLQGLNSPEGAPHEARYPYLAEIAGVLMNAMFLDGLEADTERMERINQTLELIAPEKRSQHPQALRHIPVMVMRPSKDLGALVLTNLNRFPYAIRHFLRGLGASDTSGWDMLSYLAFDSVYTEKLLELGYEDGMAAREELKAFLFDGAPS